MQAGVGIRYPADAQPVPRRSTRQERAELNPSWRRKPSGVRTPVQSVFRALAAPVAQTCSLLYRRFLTCHLPPASNVLPITNRRYGRLKICATANRYDAGSTPSGRRYVRPNLKPRWFAGSLQAILASSDQSLVVL